MLNFFPQGTVTTTLGGLSPETSTDDGLSDVDTDRPCTPRIPSNPATTNESIATTSAVR